MIRVIPRLRSVGRPAMPPQRTADRTHASAPRALLLPQFLAGTGHFMPRFGRCRAPTRSRQMMPYRFIQQGFIYRRRENSIRKLNRANHLIVEIDNVYAGHGYLLALRTMT